MIRPVKVTDAMLVTINVLENDAPEWTAGTTYALDAEVMKASTHRVYQSLVAGNVGHDPETEPTKWLNVRPTNRWAMFDDVVGTQTTAPAGIDVRLSAGVIDSVALLNTLSDRVRVSVSVGDTQLYFATRTLRGGAFRITDWERYFYQPSGVADTAVFTDLQVHPDAVVRIQAESPSGGNAIGTLVIGRQMDLGSTEAGANAGINDFSRKETDDFGNTTIVPRAYAKRMTVRTMLATERTDPLQLELANYRATPVVWVGEDGFDILTIYGFYKEFAIDLAYSNISYCSLTIEGLI